MNRNDFLKRKEKRDKLNIKNIQKGRHIETVIIDEVQNINLTSTQITKIVGEIKNERN
jgi:hypothetical protein